MLITTLATRADAPSLKRDLAINGHSIFHLKGTEEETSKHNVAKASCFYVTSTPQESSSGSVELQGDDPIAVEAMLCYIYGLDHNIIGKNDPIQQAVLSYYLYLVSDKYGVQKLNKIALSEFRTLIEVVCKRHNPVEVIWAIYGFGPTPAPVTRILCGNIKENLPKLMKKAHFVRALKVFPQLPLDMMKYLST